MYEIINSNVSLLITVAVSALRAGDQSHQPGARVGGAAAREGRLLGARDAGLDWARAGADGARRLRHPAIDLVLSCN